MTTLTITAKGQVTLRKELLKHLGVGPGQKVEVNTLPDGQITVRAARPTASIDGFIGLLAGRSAKHATIEEIDQAITAGWAGEA
ncbi:AbrB/MazE/SpoVT family DNA-binding domain-containing protein [Marinivivus vitaminiproducens]|uniref:AbrB/MazE/SpoVT family DNA-binding domain-containing protein n=1 Tax=Marinivivus vitaminiproducens TaxID=3035935 RepID=UPI0027A6D2B2|nr:AbrB/MazE/SpoVT family DNA-binding domain-containing protein [Geminicoccaceae bacterium SCSIO 64248]